MKKVETPQPQTEEILSQYVMPDESGQKYPALQATDYQPRNLNTEIRLGLGVESLEMLTEAAQESIAPELIECQYKDGPVPIYVLEGLRWVILGVPKLFIYEKDSGRYRPIRSGEVLAGTKNVTAARLHLAAVKDGVLILGDSGPQVFTLNLKSSRTGMIKSRKPEKGDGTIFSLNQGLKEHYKMRGILTHLVSAEIEAVPQTFSNAAGDSSIGIMFRLGAGAKALTPAQQAAIHNLINTDDFRADVADPFRVGAGTQVAPEIFEDDGPLF